MVLDHINLLFLEVDKNTNNAFCIYFRLDERPSWSIVKNAINTKNYGICNTLSLYKKQLPIWGCSKIISLTLRGGVTAGVKIAFLFYF